MEKIDQQVKFLGCQVLFQHMLVFREDRLEVSGSAIVEEMGAL